MPIVPKSVRIIVVSTLADPLAEVLRIHGYDAMAVSSAQEAIALANMCCPQAVVSDICIGQMGDGVQLGVKIAEAFPACKVIIFANNMRKASRFLTGYTFPLLKRPNHPADLVTFVETVDGIVLSSMETPSSA